MTLPKFCSQCLGLLRKSTLGGASKNIFRRLTVLPEASKESNESTLIDDGDKDKEVGGGNDFHLKTTCAIPPELRLVLPDFMPEPDFKRRHPIAEKLERMDMLRRRLVVDIPEFYVGSVLAITVSDQYAPKCSNRFVGICISRDDRGLRHHMTLRNVVDGIGVEVRYNIYNPMVQKIEVLKLEKRLDEELLYLRDALPEYSTFPFNMEPVVLPPGSVVPTNPIKVKLKPPPWTKKWEHFDLMGVDNFWQYVWPHWKHRMTKTKFEPWKKYDIVEHYKRSIPQTDQRVIYDELKSYDREQRRLSGGRKAPILSQLRSRDRASDKS